MDKFCKGDEEMVKDLMIRSSTEEFITFKVQEKDKGIQVRYENETLWMTQKAIAELFDVQRPAITKHLNNIFNENELDKNTVCSKMEHTAEDGKKYQTEYYFSVIDVIGALTESKDPSHYWRTLKSRIIQVGNETVTNCDTFKLKSKDGKYEMLSGHRRKQICEEQGIEKIPCVVKNISDEEAVK